MALMVEGLRSIAKREGRWSRKEKEISESWKSSRRQEHILEAGNEKQVATYKAEDGTLRMKILVKKQDLQQILEAMNTDNKKNGIHSSSKRIVMAGKGGHKLNRGGINIEQRLYHLMMTSRMRGRRRPGLQPISTACAWRPALRSIPEEL